MVVGDIQDELGIPASTLSHHLDKLKNEDLVKVRREGTFLWYTANTEALAGNHQLPLRRVLHPQQGHRTPVNSWGLGRPPDVRPGKEEQMSTQDIKEVVKEKYGQAALRVIKGGSSCCGAAPAVEGCPDPITSNLYDGGPNERDS